MFKAMRIRPASLRDWEDLLAWRNDSIAREMSLDTGKVQIKDHLVWLCRTLDDPLKIIWLGISDNGEKVGVCRFSLSDHTMEAEVSINLNPQFRGQGLGAALLLDCSNRIQNSRSIKLTARIKKGNRRSLRAFLQCHFELAEERNSTLHLVRKRPPLGVSGVELKDIYFDEVRKSDHDIKKLFELLNKRAFAISRDITLTPQKHHQFVQNHPYRFWCFVRVKDEFVGTVYLGHENVIGLNLLDGHIHLADSVLRRVVQLHDPLPEIPSVRPGYFYLNVEPKHEAMLDELNTRGYRHIQDSFQVRFD